MKQWIIVGMLVAGVTVAWGSATASGGSLREARTLVGSWQCTGQRDATGLQFLTTFNQGGTFTVSFSSQAFSETHGNWRRTGLRTFQSTDLAFIYENGVATIAQLAQASYEVQSASRLRIDLVLDQRRMDDGSQVFFTDDAFVLCNRIDIRGGIDFPPLGG